MTIIYEPYQSTLENKDGKRLFHPRTIRVGNVNTAQISREIAAYSSLSAGHVKNTLDNLVTVMTQHLQASESVTIDGLGTFRITMQSQGKGVETAEEVSAAQATLMVASSLPRHATPTERRPPARCSPEPNASALTAPTIRPRLKSP